MSAPSASTGTRFDQFAELYLRNARYSYLRWGSPRQGSAAR